MSTSVTGALTGGLINPGPVDYGKIAARNERKRQGIINLGLQQINALYGGGTAPFYSLAQTTPFSRSEWGHGGKDQTFYHLSNQGTFAPYYAHMNNGPSVESGSLAGAKYGSIVPGTGTLVGSSIGGIVGGLRGHDVQGAGLSAGTGGAYGLIKGLFGGDEPSIREQVNKRLKKGLLFNAPENQTFEGFQPSFYDKRAQDYTNYALPQLGEQYRTNRNALLYGLSNRGLLNDSSVATQARSGLERTVGQGRQAIADEAQNQAMNLRQQVENSRQQSIQQLYQSADPAQAFQSALNTTAQFHQPSAFAPISDMFSNLAKQYYTQRILNSYQQPYTLNPGSGCLRLTGSLGPTPY